MGMEEVAKRMGGRMAQVVTGISAEGREGG